MLQIALHNWNAEKVQLYIGEEPSSYFFSKVFSKYQTVVEEADLTPTQQNLQAQQMMDINASFGREVFPPSMIIPKLNITGKAEIIQFLQQQEQQAAAVQSEAQNIQHAFEEAKLKELMSKAVANISMARERAGRAESNVGLLEERLSEISKNQSLSTKAKMEALEKLVDVIGKYGEIETSLKMHEIESLNFEEVMRENQEREVAKRSSSTDSFVQEIMQGMAPQQQQQQDQNQMAMQ